MPGTVLVVCTANRCRSPLAEHQLRQAMHAAGVAWTIGSAGTHAVPGQPLDADVSAVLGELGIPAAPQWASRCLDAALVDHADLVLTAERLHRAAVTALVPAAVTRTFTLLEFARSLPADPPSPAATPEALIELVETGRIHAGPSRSADDLADPINHGRAAFRGCAEQISRAVARIASCAAPSPV